VALQGTLDTFSLPDVLRLLATTGKTGCLHLDGDRGRGSVWIDDGTLVAAAADRVGEGAPIDEVIFEMLRFDKGSFRFAVDERSPHDDQPADLEGTLRRATQLLDEWRDLEAVVPSLNHRVAMAPELTVEQVTVDADRWQALVAIAGGRSVGELGDTLGQGELTVTRTVSDLVELGIAVVQAPETRTGSGRRNVTEIGSRRVEEVPRRAGRREAASGTEGMPRTVSWARSGEQGAPGDGNAGDQSGRPLYRPEGGGAPDAGAPPRASSNLTLTSHSNGSAAPATATVTPPSGTVVNQTLPNPSTPPSGSTRAAVAPPPRSRQANTARPSRSRARATAPTAPPPPSGQTLAMPTSPPPPRTGQVLPTGPALATAPELAPDDTGGGRLAPAPAPRTPPPGFETGPLPIPEPPRGPLLPPSLDTGRLGPSALPTTTGQIPAVAATSLPPDLSWAAEDHEAPIAPPMAPAPSPRGAPGRMMNGRHEGDPAPHVVAMSPDARTAVESTIGRAGGGQGGAMQMPGTQEQILGRGHLLHFLSTVR
jgi:Domain of unknown function (DUF4388)